MKQLTIIILLSAAFFMGNAQGLHQQVPVSEKLVLNNGAKWKVDQPTSNNVTHLLQIVKVANAKTVKTLTDYHQVGTALQTGINKMIKECRMKGSDHLALHKWLEPLMEQVAKINRAPNKASAKKCFDEIKDHLNIFNRYFQV